MIQKVELHATRIKNVEQQVGKISTTLNHCKPGTLLSNTLKDLKYNGQCLGITTCSSKETIDPTIPIDYEPRDDGVDFDEAPEAKLEKLVTGAMSS